MKQTFILTATLAFFLCFQSQSTFAQRSSNQVQFKSGSYKNYENKIEFRNDDLNPIRQQREISRVITPSFPLKENEMVFEVRALMNVKADRYLAVFNLTQVGETAVKTDALINNRINGFKEKIAGLGIAEKDVYVDMIYMIPTFEFEVEKKLFSTSYNEVPSGFEMQKNLHVTFTDINKIDELVTMAAENEIYDLVKFDFFVADVGAVNDSLRNLAVAQMNKKIASFKKLNSDLSTTYHTIKESSHAIYPESQYSDYDAFVSQSIEAMKRRSGVTKIRKPKTVAYDQLPYNSFDIVVNPNILQPVVQFTYTLQVRYTQNKLHDPYEPKNNYLILTPTGEVKKLDVTGK